MNDINKKLQISVGELIGKDYFKLEWGCKVIHDHETFFVVNNPICLPNEREIYLPCLDSKLEINGLYYEPKQECFEILGQEPTLNDVLLAIGKKGYEITCGIDENIMVININNNLIPLFINKSIFNQSPEVKQQLLDLITK